MNVLGSGFIPILIFSSVAVAIVQENTILAEDNLIILTEGGLDLLRES